MNDDNSKFQSLFESVKNKCDFVANADNTLDGKAAALLGFEITIGIGYLSFVVGGLQGIKFYEGLIGLVLLIASIALLLWVNWPKDYTTISVNLIEYKEYTSKTEEKLLLQLISDAQNAFTINNKILKEKAKIYKIAILLLIVSSIFLMLSKVVKFYV